MRRILIESARRRQAARQGVGGLEKLSASATGFDVAAPEMGDAELLRPNKALEALALHDPRKAERVKPWSFVGLSLEKMRPF